MDVLSQISSLCTARPRCLWSRNILARCEILSLLETGDRIQGSVIEGKNIFSRQDTCLIIPIQSWMVILNDNEGRVRPVLYQLPTVQYKRLVWRRVLCVEYAYSYRYQENSVSWPDGKTRLKRMQYLPSNYASSWHFHCPDWEAIAHKEHGLLFFLRQPDGPSSSGTGYSVWGFYHCPQFWREQGIRG